MDWTYGEEVEEFLPEHMEISTVCCGKQMEMQEENKVQIFVCVKCGYKICTTESIESQPEEVFEYSKKQQKYGSKSGENYLLDVKEGVMKILANVREKYKLGENIVNEIISDFLKIRREIIPRADPRIGIIAACVHHKTKIPKSELGELMQIEQKFLTKGFKKYSNYFKLYENYNLRAKIVGNFKSFNEKMPEPLDNKTLLQMCNFALLCRRFYIGYNTNIKTNCTGILWYYIVASSLNISKKQFEEITGVRENTKNKFYDKLLVYLNLGYRIDGKYHVNFMNRYNELNRYIELVGWSKIYISPKQRFKKYYKTYCAMPQRAPHTDTLFGVPKDSIFGSLNY